MSDQGPFKSKYQNWVDDLKRLGVDFRTNELNDSLEVLYENEWQLMDEFLEAAIKTDLREIGYGSKKKGPLSPVLDACKKLARQQRYHPVKDYFQSLRGKYAPSTNGPYVINSLAPFFQNPDGMFITWLFKWMVGAIAKVYQGERNPLLVLVGPQNIGKSYLARWLCPIDRETYFVEQAIRPDDKDSSLRLTDTLVWEVAELGATTRRADVESLKAFITQRFPRERRSYGKYDNRKPALCSFIGSVNFDGAGFLNDVTGSTRFLSCEVLGIDFDYAKLIDIHLLWAEAYFYYCNFSQCWKLTAEEEKTQQAINAKYEMVSEMDEALDNAFEFTANPDDFMTSLEVRNHLASHGFSVSGSTGASRELARHLYKRGVIQGRAKFQEGQPHLRGYIGIKKANAQKLS